MADTWVDLLTDDHEAAADPHPQYGLAVDLAFKKAVRVVATANITKSGTQTIDGVALSATDRVLLAGQTAPAENGIWLVAAGAWTRALDLNVSAEFFAGVAVCVAEGTAGAGFQYYLATTGTITVDTTGQTWTVFGYLPKTGGTLTGTLTTRDVILQSTYKLKFASDALIRGDTGGGLYVRNYGDTDYAALGVLNLNASGNVDAGPNGHLGFGGGGIRAMIKSSSSDVIAMRDAADTAYANLYCNNFYPQGGISIGTSYNYECYGRYVLKGIYNGCGAIYDMYGSALAVFRCAAPGTDTDAAVTYGWLNTTWFTGRTAITSGLDVANDYLVLYDDSAATTKKIALQHLPVGDHGTASGLGDDDHPQYLLRADVAWKAPVRVVATTNISRTATQTIDGVALLAGERILLTAETSAQYNGVWIVAAGAWSRATDMDSSAEFFRGLVVLVNEGTAGAGTIWRYDTATSGFTLDTTTQTWTQISGGSGISGALISRTVYTTGTGATHTPNASAQTIKVICVGAGGGGGGAAQGGGQSGVGGGGGSGGITEKWWTPSGNITYTVGAFGAKGAAGNNPGAAGGDTTASGTSLALTAKGGNGGASMAFGTTHLAALGGGVNAGTTGGDFNVPTGMGGTGVRQGGTLGISGNGASCGNYGQGGTGGQVNSAGLNGAGYGAGGGGAHANGTGGADQAGGDGAGGLIIIEEYY